MYVFMDFPSVFKKEIADQLIDRINKLSSHTKALWGKMSVDQMLAHCCVSYEMAFENKHKKSGTVTRFFLKIFVKKMVVGNKPYPKGGRTAPAFVIADERNFEDEKNRLISYILKTQELGETYFAGKESLSFGVLSSKEWNNLFYKHLDHHLHQFGV